MFTISVFDRLLGSFDCCPWGGTRPARHAAGSRAARSAALHRRGAPPPRRLALDAGAGRAGAGAVPGVPGQPRPGAALPGHRRRADAPPPPRSWSRRWCSTPSWSPARSGRGRCSAATCSPRRSSGKTWSACWCWRCTPPTWSRLFTGALDAAAADAAGAGRLRHLRGQRHAVRAEAARRPARRRGRTGPCRRSASARRMPSDS